LQKKINVVGEDIHEGKRSLMVIHSLTVGSPEQCKRLVEILNSKTEDPVIINEAIAIMKATDSLTYSRGVAKDIIEKAWKDIDPLLPENEAKKKLRVFANYLINRQV